MKRYSRGGCNQAQIFSVVFRFSERISDGNRTSAYPVSVATEQGFAASSPYPKTCGGREYHVEIDSRLKNMPHRETEPGIIPLRLPEAARRAPGRGSRHTATCDPDGWPSPPSGGTESGLQARSSPFFPIPVCGFRLPGYPESKAHASRGESDGCDQ